MHSFRLGLIIGFDQFRRGYAGGLEDWLLIPKVTLAYGFAGSSFSMLVAFAVPSFDDELFSFAYVTLTTISTCLAFLVAGRTATVMKFETGLPFLDIPRLSRAFRFAFVLVLPCILLQTVYPLKSLLAHAQLTAEDVKPVRDLVRLYEEIRTVHSVSFQVVSNPDDTLSVSQNDLISAVSGAIARIQVWLTKANDNYNAIERLRQKYPTFPPLSVSAERVRLNVMLQRQLDALGGMSAESVNSEIAERRKRIDDKLKVASDLDRPRIATELTRQLAALKEGVTIDMPPVDSFFWCFSSMASPLGCQLLGKFDQLNELRKRSFGPNLFPEHITSGHELAPLYAILFGLHGALPVLAIAITFAALLRIVRLTEVRWPYTTGMIGLVAIAIWPLLPHFPLLQLWNVVEFIQPRPMEAVFRESHIGAFFALILWLLAAFVMAAGSRKTKTIMYEAELVRVGMLGFPMIILLATSYLWDFIFLIEWRVAWYFFVSWVLAVAEILLVIAIVQRLDIEMVELNCRPRLN